MTACVLLRHDGFVFHPGPPEGPDFEGLVRLYFIRLVREGEGPAVLHTPTGTGVTVASLFNGAREAFGQNIDSLDLFVGEAAHGDFILVGPGVPQELAES